MVSAIASQHPHVPEKQTAVGKPQTGEGFSPGRSTDAVGHLAKIMVAAGGDMDAGAQGRAASKIARMDITVLTAPPVETPTE
ncbi:hypothetical protein EN904_15025 [Mesorhizobium sp. M7A.F.Ca.CA.001.07.2.1]|nr:MULTISPECIES: hypothetical protein [Mesorhizobium]RUZ96677.1 hypothetical protein EN939_36500 [Mesorhizobium sp. M7A.F.Ca.CA.002.05.1.1]RVB20832.1 hypothetical protein EN918_30985 [Mesorhizobium sp. M7A.F.Ca.CA.004.05.1.1]MCF6126300.1 hypothetical protein [Mesorhizobium ciceri]MCQ8816313.1 hypothetical protein [Mesorhizobium sp. SEMIA396]RUX64793.1 hypothetical protein EN983_33970 [Mesorhizobium sp. M7A.F.Ca.CA.004.08.2.1]